MLPRGTTGNCAVRDFERIGLCLKRRPAFRMGGYRIVHVIALSVRTRKRGQAITRSPQAPGNGRGGRIRMNVSRCHACAQMDHGNVVLEFGVPLNRREGLTLHVDAMMSDRNWRTGSAKRRRMSAEACVSQSSPTGVPMRLRNARTHRVGDPYWPMLRMLTARRQHDRPVGIGDDRSRMMRRGTRIVRRFASRPFFDGGSRHVKLRRHPTNTDALLSMQTTNFLTLFDRSCGIGMKVHTISSFYQNMSYNLLCQYN